MRAEHPAHLTLSFLCRNVFSNARDLQQGITADMNICPPQEQGTSWTTFTTGISTDT